MQHCSVHWPLCMAPLDTENIGALLYPRPLSPWKMWPTVIWSLSSGPRDLGLWSVSFPQASKKKKKQPTTFR